MIAEQRNRTSEPCLRYFETFLPPPDTSDNKGINTTLIHYFNALQFHGHFNFAVHRKKGKKNNLHDSKLCSLSYKHNKLKLCLGENFLIFRKIKKKNF